MDPATFGTRLAASLVGPLVKKLFVREGPGAGLVDRPVRLSALVSFRGEKRTLGEKELRKLVRELVARDPRAGSVATTELDAVADALLRTLHALGDLDLDDVQAVRLGHEDLAARLHEAAGGGACVRHLGADAEALHSQLLHEACLHVLHYFTQRSAFVARTLVEQHRGLDELVSRTDLLIQRTPSRVAEDTAFEEQYSRYVATRHSRLTIYGVDMSHAREWPLDTAYLSLTAARGGAREAGLVGGEAALPLMTTYHGRGWECRHQLGQHWGNFDTDSYASEVVHRLCADGDERASVFVRSPDELAALARLGGHSNVDLSGDFTPEQILRAVDERHLRVLFLIENTAVDDLSFLARFKNLRKLVLNRCPQVSSLSPLAQLPMEELSLLGLPGLGELEVLSGFAGLTTLITDVPVPVLDLLPPAAPLECLFLPAETRDLTALAGFRSLRQLKLCLDTPLSRADWEAVAGLDRLVNLSLSPAELDGLATDGVTLEQPTHVNILARDQDGVHLGPFAEVFPRAVSLTLFDVDDADLAPLATHTRLRRVRTTPVRGVRNAERLPASVEVNPRPLS